MYDGIASALKPYMLLYHFKEKKNSSKLLPIPQGTTIHYFTKHGSNGAIQLCLFAKDTKTLQYWQNKYLYIFWLTLSSKAIYSEFITYIFFYYHGEFKPSSWYHNNVPAEIWELNIKHQKHSLSYTFNKLH